MSYSRIDEDLIENINTGLNFEDEYRFVLKSKEMQAVSIVIGLLVPGAVVPSSRGTVINDQYTNAFEEGWRADKKKQGWTEDSIEQAADETNFEVVANMMWAPGVYQQGKDGQHLDWDKKQITAMLVDANSFGTLMRCKTEVKAALRKTVGRHVVVLVPPGAKASSHEKSHLKEAVSNNTLLQIKLRHIILGGIIETDTFHTPFLLQLLDLETGLNIEKYGRLSLAAALLSIRITDHPNRNIKRYLAYAAALNDHGDVMVTYVDHPEREDKIEQLEGFPVGVLFFYLAMTYNVLDIEKLLRGTFIKRDVEEQLTHSQYDGEAVVCKAPESKESRVIINMMAMETEEEFSHGPAGVNGFDPDINDYRSRRSAGGDGIDGSHLFPWDTSAMEIIQTARSEQSEATRNAKRGREDLSGSSDDDDMEVEKDETDGIQAAGAAKGS